MKKLLHNDDLGKFLLRLSIGGLLIFHGIAKLRYGIDFIMSSLISSGLPGYVAYLVYIGELVAPLMILLGFRTRIAAFIVVVNMFFTIYLVFPNKLFSLNSNGGLLTELNWLFLLGSLALVFLGSGKYSISRAKGIWD